MENEPDYPDETYFRKILSEEGRRILENFRLWFKELMDETFSAWRKTRAKVSSSELFVNSGVIEGAIISRINLLPKLFLLPDPRIMSERRTKDSTKSGNRDYRNLLDPILLSWRNNFQNEIRELELLMTQGNYYFEDKLAEHTAFLRFSAYDPVIRMQKLFE